MRFKSSLLLLPLLACACMAADDNPKLARMYVSFEGASSATVVPGRPSQVELRFRVKDGYHINSNKPKSELLIPTILKLDPPSDLASEGVVYPPGKDLSFPFDPSEKLNVYSGEFTVSTRLSASRKASPGNFTVHGELKYQACSDNACFPPKDIPLQFDVKVARANSGHRGTPQSPHIH
jgi:Disulphide bond corrector protein DsbC